MSLNEIVRYLAGAGIRKKSEDNVTTLLNVFSKLAVEVQAAPVIKRLQDQSCAPPL